MPCPLPCDKNNETSGTNPKEVLFQRRCANFVYVVPEGLRELMSDISREVIRAHPTNLNIFIADYLNTLMITRENAKVALRFVEDVGDTGELLANFMKHTNLTRYQIDKSARIIQRAFKRFIKKRKYIATAVIEETAITKMMARLKVTIEEANRAATVIQHAYHLYKLRQERRYRAQENPEIHMKFRHIDWQIASQRTFDIFRHIRGVHMRDFQKAATLIQAAYRGYYTRKFIKDYWILTKKEKKIINTDDECVKRKKDKAARVLQKFFRNIVITNKEQRAVKFSVSEQICPIDPEHIEETNKIIIMDNDKIVSIEEIEIVSLRVTTSQDFEEMRDRCARIIQRFFRRVVAQRKRRISFECEHPSRNKKRETKEAKQSLLHADEVDDNMFEIDTEIENLFEA